MMEVRSRGYNTPFVNSISATDTALVARKIASNLKQTTGDVYPRFSDTFSSEAFTVRILGYD